MIYHYKREHVYTGIKLVAYVVRHNFVRVPNNNIFLYIHFMEHAD